MEVSKQYEVIVIGTGFSGIAAAKNLKKQGIENFIVLERHPTAGGTWSQNTYPGAAVDIPSPLYSLSNEPYEWSQFYCDQQELHEYTHAVIARNGLREKIQTNANVENMEWDEQSSEWNVHVTGKGNYVARSVIVATGLLSQPVIPDFPGKDKFKGKSFHTSNWDNDYDYRGKRVAVIGTGASAGQLIPAIAADVDHLTVFQRTPIWCFPRLNFDFSSWQKKLMQLPGVYKAMRGTIYSLSELAMVGYKYSEKVLDTGLAQRAMDMLNKQVEDPELRRKLTPDYTIGCKQIVISNTYYPALCRDNVTLLDKEHPIKEITEKGIKTGDGTEHEFDLIVYATGFDATDGVIPFEVKGRSGTKLTEAWSDFPRAYLGTSVPGFPNLYVTTGPNTGSAHTSALYLMESQMYYIMNSLKAMKDGGYQSVEVTPSAEQAYTDKVHEEMTRTVWHHGGCTSWHESVSGKVTVIYPGFSFNFRRMAKRFKKGDHVFG